MVGLTRSTLCCYFPDGIFVPSAFLLPSVGLVLHTHLTPAVPVFFSKPDTPNHITVRTVELYFSGFSLCQDGSINQNTNLFIRFKIYLVLTVL